MKIKIEDLEALDVKGKILLIKGDGFDQDEMQGLYSQLKGVGALGLIHLPKDTEISALGEKQLTEVLNHIKKVKDEEANQETDS